MANEFLKFTDGAYYQFQSSNAVTNNPFLSADEAGASNVSELVKNTVTNSTPSTFNFKLVKSASETFIYIQAANGNWLHLNAAETGIEQIALTTNPATDDPNNIELYMFQIVKVAGTFYQGAQVYTISTPTQGGTAVYLVEDSLTIETGVVGDAAEFVVIATATAAGPTSTTATAAADAWLWIGIAALVCLAGLLIYGAWMYYQKNYASKVAAALTPNQGGGAPVAAPAAEAVRAGGGASADQAEDPAPAQQE
jgi:hypothetical protein